MHETGHLSFLIATDQPSVLDHRVLTFHPFEFNLCSPPFSAAYDTHRLGHLCQWLCLQRLTEGTLLVCQDVLLGAIAAAPHIATYLGLPPSHCFHGHFVSSKPNWCSLIPAVVTLCNWDTVAAPLTAHIPRSPATDRTCGNVWDH